MKSYTIYELCRLTGLSARTIRGRAAYGIIRHPVFAGAVTTYPRESLARLLAANEWRKQGLSFFNIRKELNKCTEAELESHAAVVDPIAEESAAVAEAAPAVTGNGAPSAAPAGTRAPGRAAPTDGGERWIRFALVPGLELTLKEGASELATRLAGEIRGRYGAMG